MKIEHIALIVEKPILMAKWYQKNLGFSIVRSMKKSPFSHFIADSSKKIFLEIYNPGNLKIPKYKSLNPVIFHLALSVKNIKREEKRLLSVGATLISTSNKLDTGDEVCMLKDPWGISIQLVKRRS